MHRLLSDRSLRWGEPILASYPFRGFLRTWEKLGDDKIKWSDELDWFMWTNFNWVSKVIQECIAEASVSPLEGGGGVRLHGGHAFAWLRSVIVANNSRHPRSQSNSKLTLILS